MMGILLKGQPNNVQALFLRGKSYFYMDDQSMAKRHFGEALKYDPEHKEAKAEFSKVRAIYKKKAQVSSSPATPRPPLTHGSTTRQSHASLYNHQHSTRNPYPPLWLSMGCCLTGECLTSLCGGI